MEEAIQVGPSLLWAALATYFREAAFGLDKVVFFGGLTKLDLVIGLSTFHHYLLDFDTVIGLGSKAVIGL